MMKNVKVLWLIILLLLALSGYLINKFVSGSVVVDADNRISVILNAEERNYLLSEMRQFLVEIQSVSKAITANDAEAVATRAQKAGVMGAMPGTIMQKIPLEMKKLGFDTHNKFTAIAESAKSKDLLLARKQLDTLMDNCIACHATYRYPEPK